MHMIVTVGTKKIVKLISFQKQNDVFKYPCLDVVILEFNFVEAPVSNSDMSHIMRKPA